MKFQDGVLTKSHSDPVGPGTESRQTILVSRVESCSFWIIAGLLGCLLCWAWIARLSTGCERMHPLDNINPNLASKESLVRLPGIGPARAQTIIDYRQAHNRQGPVFRTPADIENVTGFGPKTVEKMMPWISFENPGQKIME